MGPESSFSVGFGFLFKILGAARVTNRALNRYVRSQSSPGADGVIERAPSDWVAALATLSDLKSRGDLAPTEFERAKRKLLAP